MGVRVKIVVKHCENSAETTALANSGYEAEKPEIHIPLALARRLGFRLEELKEERYRVIGSEISAYILGEVSVSLKDYNNWIGATAVSVPGEFEVVMSDALMEGLGVEIIKPKAGLWRVRGEEITRESLEPEYWVV